MSQKTFTCKTCKTEFHRYPNKGIIPQYCSRTCVVLPKGVTRKKREPLKKTLWKCHDCKKMFKKTAYNSMFPPMYCSIACRNRGIGKMKKNIGTIKPDMIEKCVTHEPCVYTLHLLALFVSSINTLAWLYIVFFTHTIQSQDAYTAQSQDAYPIQTQDEIPKRLCRSPGVYDFKTLNLDDKTEDMRTNLAEEERFMLLRYIESMTHKNATRFKFNSDLNSK